MKLFSSKIYVPLIVLCFLIISILIIPGLILRNDQIAAVVKSKIEESVFKTFGVKVSIERVGFHGWSPELSGIKIGEANGRRLLEAERLRISFNWFKLIFTGLSGALQKVDIFTPTVWMTRGEDGKWVIPETFLVKSKTPGKQRKSGMVVAIHNGNLQISAPEEKWPWGDFFAIDGQVDLRGYPGIKGSLAFRSSLDAEAEGRIIINFVHGGERSVEIEAEHGKARLWGEKVFGYFKLTDDYRFTAGKADAVLRFSWGERFRFTSAKVRLVDTDFKWHKLPVPLEAVDAEFDFDAKGIDFHRFTGYYNQSRFDIKGRISNETPAQPATVDLKVYAKELQAVEWGSLIPVLRKVNASGLVDLNLRIQGALSKPQLQGEVLLKDGSLALPGGDFNLEHLRLFAELDGEEIRLTYAEGYLNKALFFLRGTLNGWDDPDLDLAFKIKGFQSGKLLSVLDQSLHTSLDCGPVDLDVQISKRLSAPLIKGQMHTAFLSWRGFTGKNLHLSGEYDWGEDLLKIQSLTLRAFAGMGRIKGAIGSLRERRMVLDLKTDWKQVDLAKIPWQELAEGIPALTGRADFQLALDGALPSLQAVCDLNVRKASVGRFEFDLLDTKIIWDQEKVTARLALTKADGGMRGDLVWKRGTSNFSADLLLRNLEVDSQWLPEEVWFGPSALHGKLNGAINVQHERTGPVGEGWLEVHNLTYAEKRLGDLKLRGILAGRRIELHDSSLLVEGNHLGITGEVSWEQQPYYNLRLYGADLTADPILSLLWSPECPVKVDGLGALLVSLQGWKDPELSGELSLNQLSLYGIEVERVEAGFVWNDRILSLKDLRFYQEGGELSIAGKVTGDELDLSVLTTGLPLTSLQRNGEHLLVLAGKEITGQLKMDGRITGQITAPIFNGEVKVDELSLAGLDLDQITGQLIWKDNILFLDELRVFRADQQLMAYGQVDFNRTFHQEKPTLDLGIKMEEAKISDLLLVLGVSSKATVDGKVDGYLRVLGPLNQPLVRVISHFREGRVNGFSNLSGELDLQMEGKTVAINRLILDDREGRFSASCIYTPGQYLQASVRMSKFPLETIMALTDYDLPLSGRVNLQADFDTRAQGMTGVFSGGITGAFFGKARIPSFHLTGELNDDLLFINYEGIEDKLKIWGNIPLSPQWFGPLDLPSRWPHHNQEWDVRLVAKNLDAVLLNPFFADSPEAGSSSGVPLSSGNRLQSGTINSDLSLKGIWNNLYLQGRLEVKDLDAAFRGLPEEFRNVQAKLNFSKDRLEIMELKGRYGDGRFQAGGGIALHGLKPVNFDLSFNGDNLYYVNPLFKGLIDARLQLSGPFTEPLLSGGVTVEKTRISIGSLNSSGSPRDLALRFDLDIKTGREVYFRQYGLANIPISGGIHVGGTLKKPVLNGEFTADRGSVTVYGDTFRVKTARAEFKPEYLTLPYLELEAGLHLSGTEITLSTQGWLGDELALQLTSNPAMSREEIFALLNWVEGFDNSSDQIFVANLVQGNINTVTDTLFGPMLDEFRDLMNIDYFSVEQDRDLGSFKMNLGKSIDDDVYLSYSRSLTDITEEVWTLEWQLSPAFSLIGDYSTNSGYKWQLLYRLMF